MTVATSTGGAVNKRTTIKEKKRRLDLVERTMTEAGWSGRIVRVLASQLDVDVRTIYRYRDEVLDDIEKAYRGINRSRARAEFISRLRDHQAHARGIGSMGSVSGMMGIEARVLGIDRPLEEVDAEDHANLSRDELLDRLASELDPEMVEAIRVRQRH